MITHPLVARFRDAYALLIRSASYLQSPFLLVVRLYWGFSFFQTGWGKLSNLSKVTGFFTDLHIPFPMYNALLAALTECFGGLLLLLGLGSRLISIPLTFLLCVAFLTADSEALHDADKFVKADEFPFLFTVLLILIFGPGAISIDHLLKKKFGAGASESAASGASS